MRSPSRRNLAVQLVVRGMASLAVVGLCLTAGEIFTRIVAGPPASFLFSGSFRDRRVGWDLVYGVDEGLRRVSCIDESEERRRIAVIGDSFVFGQGVPDCRDFSALLNTRQSELHFVNLGNIGSGPAEYRVVGRDLVDASYDRALLVFYGNDFLTDERRSPLGLLADELSTFALIRKFERSRQVAARMEQIDAELRKEHAHLAVHNNLAAMIEERDRAYARRCTDPGRAALERFEVLFDRILDALERNIPREHIWVTMAPQGSTVSEPLRTFIIGLGGEVPAFGEPGEAYLALRRLAASRGLQFIETFDAFLQDGANSYWPDDLHWNQRGHERMADLLADTYGAPPAEGAGEPR